MNHGSLFSGIGGFDLASEWMGWENKFHCEWNEFGQKVLNYYWPNAELFNDITKSNFKKYANRIDVLTGGFPCQPYSQAGKRKGKEDERHLWPEMLRAIREIQPSWIVGENVLGLLNWNGGLVFHEVQTDLEAAGFIMFPYVLPACAKNAPHRRDRVWFVAYSNRDGQQRSNSEHEINASERGEYALNDIEQITIADTCGFGLEGSIQTGKHERQEQQIQKGGKISEYLYQDGAGIQFSNFPTEPAICSRNDGLQSELVGITVSKHRTESIKAYGNAIVPQVAYEIFKAIEKYNQ